MAEITVVTPGSLRAARLNIYMSAPTLNKTATCIQIDGTNDVALPEGFTGVFKTNPLQYDQATMGPLSNCIAQLTLSTAAASGNATVKIGRISVRKVAGP